MLSPVVSVVFYHGASVWTAAKKMSELIRKMPKEVEELEQYIQQSSMLLITPWNVDVSVLKGGWKEIFELLRRQNKEAAMKKYLEKHRDIYRNLPEDTKRLMFALVGRLDYYEELKKKGRVTDLCKAFDDHYRSGYRRGERRGERKGMQQGIVALVRDNLEFGVSHEMIIKKLQTYFSLSEEDACRYIQKQMDKV